MGILEVGRTHIEIQDTANAPRVRVAEVRGWSDTSASSESDTSIIGNLDSSGKNIKRSTAGSAQNALTLTAYFDTTDTAQLSLRAGKKFFRAFIVEDDVDRVTYDTCEVLSRNKNGTEIDGLVGMDLSITVNGDINDSPAAAQPADDSPADET